MQQNTPEWHAWRLNGIGASESAIILGCSPYKTLLELYKIKTGELVENNEDNEFVKNKGHKLEKVARAKFELQTGLSFPDTLAENEELPFIKCSLDGYNETRNEFCEIKYVGEKQFKAIEVAEDIIKLYPHYYAQIQHQTLVTGGLGVLVMINAKEKIKVIPVPADLDYLVDLKAKLVSFWNMVINKTPPGASKDDIIALPDNKQFILAKYKVLSDAVKHFESLLEEAKAELLEGLEKINYQYNGAKISYIEKIGNVEYKNIPELTGVDLEKYRKPSTAHYQIKI